MSAFEGLKKSVGEIFTTLRLKDAELEQLRKDNYKRWAKNTAGNYEFIREAHLKHSKEKLVDMIESLRNSLHKEITTTARREGEKYHEHLHRTLEMEKELGLLKKENDELRKENAELREFSCDFDIVHTADDPYEPEIKCNVCAIEIIRESEDYDNCHLGEDMEATCQDCWHHYISTHDECPDCDEWFISTDIMTSGVCWDCEQDYVEKKE